MSDAPEAKSSYPWRMEDLVSLCARRGLVFPSSEIYGGINGFWDYGPLGAQLKKNLRDAWWEDVVLNPCAGAPGPNGEPVRMVPLDTSIIQHPKVWEASGHIAGFSDPMVDCRETKQRYRFDHLQVYVPVSAAAPGKPLFAFMPDTASEAKQRKRAEKAWGELATVALAELPRDEWRRIVAPDADQPGTLTEPRAFNLMFRTYIGATATEDDVAYLRPETAQGIFVQFKNVIDTTRVKLPFGIAQVGKSFRNEITPRNFIFRSREFEQMEMEYFIHEDADWAKCHQDWIEWCKNWLISIGLPESHLSLYAHPKEKLAFYSKGTVDIMFRYPFGVQELWGIAARGNYDLTQHATASGKPQEMFDEATKKKFVPHVIEPAVGVDRILLAALCAGYAEEDVTDEKGNTEKRTVLRFSPRIAPVKVAVLPLLKNKEPLTNRAKALHAKLQRRYAVQYDDGGAIGKRYRRQDEAGTPWCVTIDFDTIEKPGDTFTLRERDSMQQKRINEAELFALL
ncbi:MAG TPA: glycine--tRNA ligase, partial [Myxococcota bacterium]|nr:glycine--tRNA ligase [Myxococcota bacterium]